MRQEILKFGVNDILTSVKLELELMAGHGFRPHPSRDGRAIFPNSGKLFSTSDLNS